MIPIGQYIQELLLNLDGEIITASDNILTILLNSYSDNFSIIVLDKLKLPKIDIFFK